MLAFRFTRFLKATTKSPTFTSTTRFARTAATMSQNLDNLKDLDTASVTKLYSSGVLKKSDNTEVPDGNDVFNNIIHLYRGDITQMDVDAIVNAANTWLLGGGGVDGAIHKAAGKQLKEECRTLNGCDTGDAKITAGYKLPAKHVIHAVGPVYTKKLGDKNAELLSSCYLKSLNLAVNNKCRSIVFPCISTGVYDYPSDDASIVALDTVREFIEGDGKAKLFDKIIFCCFLDKDVTAYIKNIPEFFPPAPATASDAQ